MNDYPEKLRRIKYHDEETGKTLVFLTNNTDLKAEKIALLYKPMQVNGNVYYKGAKPYNKETNYVEQSGFDPQIKIVEEGESVYLYITLDKSYKALKSTFITTEFLGKTMIPNQAY